MKTIVIQRHSENLDGIKAAVAEINNARAEEIIYTPDPQKVLQEVRGEDSMTIVSGQVLSGTIYWGTDLARQIKKTNPKALFFIYSVMPERNESVDGIIPKEDGTIGTGEHSLLARVLTSDLEHATPRGVKTAFPEILILEKGSAVTYVVENDF